MSSKCYGFSKVIKFRHERCRWLGKDAKFLLINLAISQPPILQLRHSILRTIIATSTDKFYGRIFEVPKFAVFIVCLPCSEKRRNRCLHSYSKTSRRRLKVWIDHESSDFHKIRWSLTDNPNGMTKILWAIARGTEITRLSVSPWSLSDASWK